MIGKKGFVLDVFFLFFTIGLIIGMIIFAMLVSLGLVKLRVDVEVKFEYPSMSKISANSFMMAENDYKSDTSHTRNVISLFGNSGDDPVLRQAIADMMDTMFGDESGNIMIKIGELYFNGGLMGDHETNFIKVAYPEGLFEKIQMRFYL